MPDQIYFKDKFKKGYKILKADYDDLIDSIYFKSDPISASGSLVPIIKKSADYEITLDDLEKVITFSVSGNLILPPASGFQEGFQCVVWNQINTTDDVTITGTFNGNGTKISQYMAVSIVVVDNKWFVAGGLE